MYKNFKLTIVDAKLIKSLLKLYKACGFQRQRLWSQSSDCETPLSLFNILATHVFLANFPANCVKRT